MHTQTYDTRARTSFTTLHVPTFVQKRRTRADQVRVAPPEPRSPPSCAQRPPEHPVRTRDPRERQRAPKRRAVRLQAATPAHRPFPHASRDSATLAAHTTLRPPRAAAETVVGGGGGDGCGDDGGRQSRRLAALAAGAAAVALALGPRSASALALGPRQSRMRTHASTRESILDPGLAQVVGGAGGARVRVGVGSPVDRRGTPGGSTQTEE